MKFLPGLIFAGAVLAALVALALLAGRQGEERSPVHRRRRALRRAGLAALVMATPLLGYLLLTGRLIEGLVVLLAAGVLGWELIQPVSEGEAREHHQRNPRYCGRCGYDLTGQRSGACPECGWRVPPAKGHDPP